MNEGESQQLSIPLLREVTEGKGRKRKEKRGRTKKGTRIVGKDGNW